MDNDVDILLVEDNPRDVELIMRALKKNNLARRLAVVKDGEEALEFIFGTGRYAHRANAVLPQVMFLDLKLPKVSGIEVLQQIRADARTKTLPIVVMTSAFQERDISAAYKLGANSYVVKPINFEQFTKTVVDLGNYWLAINQAPMLR